MAKNIEDVYPLAPIQQGLAFELEYRQGTGVYIEQLVISLTGELDQEVFERAWQLVVERHPILRTTFHWRGTERAVQVVHRTGDLPLEVLDWRDHDEAGRERELTDWMLRERISGFDHERLPLMRTTVIRNSSRDWTFFWRFSHLLMDGWSFGLAMLEFAGCYRALVTGTEPALQPARPYRDYMSWWAAADAAQDEPFWRRELAGFRPPQRLSLGGRPVPPGTPTHGFLEVGLDGLAEEVRALAHRHQLTVNTVVQGAWLVLLSRYFGRTDVVCGATIAHRPENLRGAETILGPMIVTLPVRERIDPGRAVLSWLAEFQLHLAAVRDRCRLPLAEISGLVPTGTEAPLLQTSVSFENVPLPELPLDDVGLKVTDTRYDGRPHFPLTMVIMPGAEMPLRIVHDRTQFDRVAVQRIAADLIVLLRQIVTAGAEETIGGLVMSATDGATDLRPVGGPRESLVDSIRAQGATRPDAVAVVDGDRRLTYADLVARVDVLAGALRDAGVRRGDRVALCLDRSAAFVTAVLATLTAGGSYVPLDPTNPAARLAENLADAAPRVVLTTAGLADRLAHDAVLLIDADAHPVEPAEPTGSPDPADLPGPDDVAYVIYTSGSTGRPKGVPVTHANVQSMLAAGRDLFGFHAGDTFSFVHSCAFDYSVWEMFNPLATGATLVVVPYWTARSPDELWPLLCAQRVSVLSLTPAVFESVSVIAAESGEPPQALRHVFLGGDRLDAVMLQRWAEQFGLDRPAIHNLYGVTEATVVSTHHRITEADLAAGGPVPIGQALPNQRPTVLDDTGCPVPPGVTGELEVAGPAVSTGYLHRGELTRHRFRTRNGLPGYRTGDLVRAGADGTLDFVGRADDQVKLRGMRVELGEIEAALRSHPAVDSAAAVVATSGVLAYAVPGTEPVPTPVLIDHVAMLLPEHMVPVEIGWLTTLPTNANGKLDRAALGPLDRPTPDEELVEPRSAWERNLATALQELLNVERIGLSDRLSELGLHSLAAMRLTARLRAEHRISVPLRQVLEALNLETLARAVENADRGRD